MSVYELWAINIRLLFPGHIDLKELRELWFKSKEIILNLKPIDIDKPTVDVSWRIFQLISERIETFLIRWMQKKEIELTDEELEILTEAFNEASWAFNFLENNYPDLVKKTKEDGFWEKLEQGKKIVQEEITKRQKVKDLQVQITSIENQPKNNDNEEKIRKLQEQLNVVKNPQKDNYFPPNKDLLNSNDNQKGIVGKITIGIIGAILVFLLLLLLIKNNTRNKRENPN